MVLCSVQWLPGEKSPGLQPCSQGDAAARHPALVLCSVMRTPVPAPIHVPAHVPAPAPAPATNSISLDGHHQLAVPFTSVKQFYMKSKSHRKMGLLLKCVVGPGKVRLPLQQNFQLTCPGPRQTQAATPNFTSP